MNLNVQDAAASIYFPENMEEQGLHIIARK